jgi:hypothetical protein
VLRAEFLKLQAAGYDELAERLAGKQERSDVIALSGHLSRRARRLLDDKADRDLRVIASTMAGCAPSFNLLTRSRSAHPGCSRSTRPSESNAAALDPRAHAVPRPRYRAYHVITSRGWGPSSPKRLSRVVAGHRREKRLLRGGLESRAQSARKGSRDRRAPHGNGRPPARRPAPPSLQPRPRGGDSRLACARVCAIGVVGVRPGVFADAGSAGIRSMTHSAA